MVLMQWCEFSYLPQTTFLVNNLFNIKSGKLYVNYCQFSDQFIGFVTIIKSLIGSRY